MEPETSSLTDKMVGKIRQSPTVRLFLIGLLILVLLIPSGMIQSLISERQHNHDNAVNEISDKWGHEQVITGPLLAIPYPETRIDDKGKAYEVQTYTYYLPDNLEVTGDMSSEKRHRGIYEAVLYETKLRVKGQFANDFMRIMPALPPRADLNGAKLLVGISDVRGIRSKMTLHWDSTTLKAEPGVTL